MREALLLPVRSRRRVLQALRPTALAWLEQGVEVGEPRAKPLSDRLLRLFLRGCDQEWLIEQLMTAAKSDRLLHARLAAAAGQKNAFDDRDIRVRLERAIDIPDFVDYGGAHGYFMHVDEALDEVERLVGAGFADATITLAEYALELLESSAERVDDSDVVGCPFAAGEVAEAVRSAVGADAPVHVVIGDLVEPEPQQDQHTGGVVRETPVPGDLAEVTS